MAEKSLKRVLDLRDLGVEMQVVVTVYDTQDAEASMHLNENGLHTGLTIDEARALIGGDEGTVTDFTGRAHQVSLKPWVNQNSITKRVIFSFVARDENAAKIKDYMKKNWKD